MNYINGSGDAFERARTAIETCSPADLDAVIFNTAHCLKREGHRTNEIHNAIKPAAVRRGRPGGKVVDLVNEGIRALGDPAASEERVSNGSTPQLEPLQDESGDLLAAVQAVDEASDDEKLRVFQAEVGRLGRCDHLSTDDITAAMLDIASRHECLRKLGDDTLQHVVRVAINGGEAIASASAGDDLAEPSDIGSFQNGKTESEYSWSDPDWSLLDDRRGDLPEFPVETLPEWMRAWIKLAAHGAGVTPGHVAAPFLSIASSMIGVARRVQASRPWSEPMTLWAAVVGASGSGKTPGIDVTKRHLSDIERTRKDRIADLQRQHETRVEAAKASLKKWKAEVEEAVEAGMPPPPRPIEATDVGAFVAPRLSVSDVTVERLAVLLQARPRGTLVILDELAGLFLNMGRYSGGSDREFWLEAWNGKGYTVERMGRPPVVLDNLLVGVVGGLQPDKLVKSFEGDQDGMYARVLFAWPREPSYKPLTNDIAEIEPEITNALCRLIDLEDTTEDGAFFSRPVPLSNDASSTFERFREFRHGIKSGLAGRELEWCAKGESHVLRLAGTLAYLEWANKGGEEPAEIDDGQMQAAITLWREFFWPHSRAALRQIGLSERHANARQALRWIRSQDKAEVSLQDIRRDALGQRFDAKQTGELMDALTLAGWARPKVITTGGRAARRWEINSSLKGHAGSAGSAERGGDDASEGVSGELSALPALSATHIGEPA